MTDTEPMAKSNDDSIQTRSSLLSRLQNGDGEKGWQEFFDIYWPFIYHSALSRSLSDADAQDVTQQTLVAVWRGLPTFRYDPKRAAFKTWLIGILKHRIADLERQKVRRPAEASIDEAAAAATIEQVPDPGSDPTDVRADAEWEANLLRAARERVWKRISRRELQIYEYYEQRERHVRATARELNITAARVHVARYRVEKELKKEIDFLRKNWF